MPKYLVSYQWWPLKKPKEMHAGWTTFEAKNDKEAKEIIQGKFRERGPEDIKPTTYRVLNAWKIRIVSLD